VKKFHFPLERVREWREKQVSFEEAALERLNAERAAIEERAAELDRERESNESAVLNAVCVDALSLRALDEYRRFARYRAASLVREGSACDGRIAVQRARIMEARRKVRLLDKLRDKKRRLWMVELEKEVDEQAAESYRARRASLA
jgi:flagellar export protein FliJ